MKIKQLSILSAFFAERIASIHESAITVEVFYLAGDSWYGLDGTMVKGESRRCLKSCANSSDGINKPAGGRKVYFWVPKFSAAVVVDFSRSIYKAAQSFAKSRIEVLVEDSINKYRATHDDHTGLRNRVAFDQVLSHSLSGAADGLAAAGLSKSKEMDSTPRVGRSVALVSIDIDHFKTINDRFGHGYGDLVLAVLASRLENLSLRISREALDRYTVGVFRLGGEEFQVIVCGNLISEQEVFSIAEQFAQEIRSDVLPSTAEFEKFRGTRFFEGGQLPHEADRKVTVSVGVAVALVHEDRPNELAKRLKRQADLALYSSKFAGRDRVRYFGDILESGGRISFVDSINSVIAIDIGRIVGVRNGQEFFVFPPDYDGEVDYFQGEGRSRKRVGKFPRFRAGRIVAFDIQEEVSFCRITELTEGVSRVVESSTLQAIPLGSISHLFGSSEVSTKFEDQEALRKRLRQIDDPDSYFVVAVAVSGVETISETQGLDKANECLARVGRHLVRRLTPGIRLAQAGLGGFLVLIGPDSERPVAEVAQEIYDELSENVTDVRTGVGWAAIHSEPDSRDLEDPEGLPDAALLAALESVEKSGVRYFTVDTWTAALAKSRKTGEYAQVIADYESFSSFGLKSPSADTQLAYAYLYGPSRNLDLAETFFRQATADAEVLPIRTSNLGCFLTIYRNDPLGFSLLDSVDIVPNYAATMFFGAMRHLPDGEFVEFVRNRQEAGELAISTDQYWLIRSDVAAVRERLQDILR